METETAIQKNRNSDTKNVNGDVIIKIANTIALSISHAKNRFVVTLS
jgi:hypothetical protein